MTTLINSRKITQGSVNGLSYKPSHKINNYTYARNNGLLDGLVRAYRCENTTDETGNYNLVAQNTPVSEACVIDNGFSYTRAANNNHSTGWIPDPSGSFTISAWIRNDDGSYDTGIGIYEVGSKMCYLNIELVDWNFGCGNLDRIIGSGGNETAGSWYFLAMIWDQPSSLVWCFLDNVLVAKSTVTTFVTPTKPVRLGHINGHPQDPDSLNMANDEVYIWTKQLTHGTTNVNDTATGQISKLWNNGNGLGYPSFD